MFEKKNNSKTTNTKSCVKVPSLVSKIILLHKINVTPPEDAHSRWNLSSLAETEGTKITDGQTWRYKHNKLLNSCVYLLLVLNWVPVTFYDLHIIVAISAKVIEPQT